MSEGEPKIPLNHIKIDPAKDGPKRKGDKWWYSGNDGIWEEDSDGEFLRPDIGLTWIRPIDPGEGYELVPEDQPWDPSMSWTGDGKSWFPVCGSKYFVGKTITEIFNDPKHEGAIRAFRRPQPGMHALASGGRGNDGWISVKDRLPEVGQSLWVTDGKTVWPIPRSISLIFPEITHWQPFYTPPPPQPAKPAEEVAFEEWSKNVTSEPGRGLKGWCRESWLAALKWAEGRK